MEEFIAAIDLGTTKVVTILGRRSSDNKVHVIATSELPSKGIMRGEVLNIREVEESIRATVNDVRQKSGIDFKEVYVGIAGQHIRRVDNRLDNIRHDDNLEISEREIEEMTAKMYKTSIEPGEKILHVIPQSYNVDSHFGIVPDDVVGMLGQRLEGNYRIFVGKTQSANYTQRCVEQAGLKLKQLILEPLASAKAVLTDDEKTIGVAMVDIGGGTTDLVVYYDDIVRHTAVIPFGGNVVTEDIRQGCGVLPRHAEHIKLQYGSCFSDLVKETVLALNVGGREARQISLKCLANIIEARMSEIIEAVMYEIERSGYADKLSAGIVFTGGGAMIRQLSEFVRNKTGMEARIAQPVNISADSIDEVKSCTYSTAVGLLLKGMEEYVTVKEPEKVLQPVGKNIEKEPNNPKPPRVKTPRRIKNPFGNLSLFADFFETDNAV